MVVCGPDWLGMDRTQNGDGLLWVGDGCLVANSTQSWAAGDSIT